MKKFKTKLISLSFIFLFCLCNYAFFYAFDNHKLNYDVRKELAPNLSNNGITLLTPENITYTDSMDGYFPATYGFENDENDVIPQGWEDYSQTYAYVKVVNGIGGHNKVLECYSGTETASYINLRNYFEPQVNGMIEWWWRKSSIQSSAGFFMLYGSAGVDLIQIRIDLADGKIMYNDPTGTATDTGYPYYSDDKWIHMRIEFNCSSDTWSLWIDTIKYIDNIAFKLSRIADFVNRSQFWSFDGGNPTLYYVDAIGYSWDPNYNIGDNLNEGLLVSFDTKNTLDRVRFSLDNQAKKPILGNTTIPMPEDGLYSIKIFGIDQLGVQHQSNIRYFTVDFPIDIFTPEAKIYTEPMRGYYLATFGFEEVASGDLPPYCYYNAWGTNPDWTNSYTRVIDGKTDSAGNSHKKVLVLNDRSGSSACGSYLNFTEYASEIARNCKIEFYFCIRTEGPSYYVSHFEISGNNGHLLQLALDNTQGGLNNPEIRYWNSTGNYLTGVYQEWDKWYRYSFDISCDGGYAGLGANQYRFRVYNDTGDLIYTSIDMGFVFLYPSTGGPNRFRMSSSQSQTLVYEYLDAFGITGLQDNYELGNNLNEGLLLSYDNSPVLDWQGYSLDGQSNRTILGGTAIPLPGDGQHSIRVFGNDSSGSIYQSNVRQFSVYHLNIITPEEKVYNEPMKGYYPATFGFENDFDGTWPNRWTSIDAGGTIQVISDFSGHNKIVELYDMSSGANDLINKISDITEGIIEFWMGTNNVVELSEIDIWDKDDTNWAIQLSIQSSKFQYKQIDNNWYDIPNVGIPLNNMLHHWSVILNCSTHTFHVLIDGIDSGELSFKYPHNSFDRFQFHTSTSGSGFS
ncbi:MAG: hypothetical protein ACFFG0_40785, partial [Candidatus Thorarchaeota archaeon]